jgi:SAM-dependent methyltransferase
MRKCDRVKDYDEYRKIQIDRSVEKWTSTTFDEMLFFKTILTALPLMVLSRTEKCLRPEGICCMGIRKGNEYESFKRIGNSILSFRNSTIYGVDINPDVASVGINCYAHDFNNLPIDWTNKFDLIYSNSIDHSFDIQKTLDEWHRVLRDDRFMLLVLSSIHKVSNSDIYDFDEEDCKELFDTKKFDVINVWREYNQPISFNVLLRIKK